MLRFPYLTRRGNAPGYKGVRQCRGKFTAQVHRGGKRYHLGTYPAEQHAALAVNYALCILFPELPSRFLNDVPLEDHPLPEVQESIHQEVLRRLGASDPFLNRPLVDA